jgi:drug/metabolite transporter (DMT)-like permease
VLNKKQILLLIVLTLTWGLNWPIMKLSLREMSPLYFRALTMTGGALCLAVWYASQGLRMKPSVSEWRDVILLGLPNVLGWHTLSILGVSQLASGRAAILGFTMPIWTVLLGVLLFKDKLTPRLCLALLAVAAAVGLLSWHELSTLAGKPLGVAFMLGAALCWAVGTLMMRRSHLTLPVQSLTVWMMLVGSAALWIVALVAEPAPTWRYSPLLWLTVLWGMFMNYGFAQIIWFGMAKNLPPATSAMSVMAVPMIGTLSATFIVGEVPHWQDWVAVVCVITAIAAVLLQKPSAKASVKA